MLVALAAAGCGAGEQVDGAAVFERRCASCHGLEGQGGMGPPLHGQATVDIVREGRPDRGMPPFGETLSEEQIDAVVAYANAELG